MEEIDIVEKGKNYGWNIMEGTLPYAKGNQTGLELPIWTYGRDQGNATIGGYVYHGTKLTGVNGLLHLWRLHIRPNLVIKHP